MGGFLSLPSFFRQTVSRFGAFLFFGTLVFLLPNKVARLCPVAQAQANCAGTSSGFEPLGISAFDKDATIDSNNPTVANGSGTIINLANNDSFSSLNGGNEQYGVVHFDTSQINSSAAYVLLTIPLVGPSHTTTWLPRTKAASAVPGAQTTITLNPLTAGFDESSVTWNTVPAEVANSPYRQSVTFNSMALETSTDYLITFDVTRYVKDVQASLTQNNGFVLKLLTLDSRQRGIAYAVTFPARENLNTPDYPRLVSGQPAAGTGPTPPPIFPTPTPTPSSTATPSSAPTASPPSTFTPQPSSSPSPSPTASGGVITTPSTSPIPSTVLPPQGP